MGLRSKSMSLPKLSANTPAQAKIVYATTGRRRTSKTGHFIVKSDVCQLSSEKQSREATERKTLPDGREHDLKMVDVPLAASKYAKRRKQRNESRNGISQRLRGIVQSLFHLDKRGKDNFDNQHQLNSQVDALGNGKCTKCRSLPNLYNAERSSRRSASFRLQKPMIANFLRKSRRRLPSFRERNQANASFDRVTSSKDSLQDCYPVASKYPKSTASSDFPVPRSPLCDDSQHHFSSSIENSPILEKQYSLSLEDASGNSGTAIVRRERFRKSRATDFRRRYYSDRNASFSESSDVAEEGESIDLNDVIISNASVAALNRRRVPSFRSQVAEGSIAVSGGSRKAEIVFSDDEESSKEDKKESIKILCEFADREMKAHLLNKDFDAEHSKRWCSDISENIRVKIQSEMKRGFKMIVQVFIGAVQDDGIRTALQCNMNPKSDDFAAISFRNKSLFAFASLFIVDVREK